MNWNWVPKLVSVLLVLLFTGMLAWQFRQQDEQRIQSWVNYQTALLEHAIRAGYGRHLQVMNQWGRYWRNAGMSSPADTQALMDAYRADFVEVQAMGVVQGLQWYALSADDEVWLRDASLPRRHLDSIMQARESGGLAVPYDFHFPNGQAGVYLYLPFTLPDQGPDLNMVAINLQIFMSNRVNELFADQPVRVIVRDERHRVIFDSAPGQAETPFVGRFQLDPDGDGAPWEFVLLLTEEGVERQTIQPYAGLIASSALLLAVLFLVFRTSTRSQRLARELGKREQLLARQLEELNQARDRLNHLLYHDKLTDLPNRKALLRDLEQDREQARDANGYLVRVQLLGNDRIREVYGYENSKTVLRACAERMQHFLSEKPYEAILYALDGEAFVVWLKSFSENLLREWHQGWCATMEAPFHLKDMQVSLSHAMGVLVLNGRGREHPEEWLQQAEVALSQALLVGSPGFVLYRDGMLDRARRRMELGGHLSEFLQGNSFQLYYQPVVDLSSGRVRSIEAFLRLNHPDFGTVAPVVFIPLAESNGMVQELDRWAIRQACRDWPALKALLPDPVRLELNLSRQTLLHAGFVEWLLEVVETAGMSPSELCLNLTRELNEATLASGKSALETLREKGVELALDVESPHFHSLALLHGQPLSLLKIDRSIVLRLRRDDGVTGVLHGLMELADQLNLQVVAEGVETAEAADWLRDVGCQYAQGYFFVPPLPLHTLLDRLAADQADSRATQEP